METCPRCGVAIPAVTIERTECPTDPQVAELDRLTDHLDLIESETIDIETASWSEVADV